MTGASFEVKSDRRWFGVVDVGGGGLVNTVKESAVKTQ